MFPILDRDLEVEIIHSIIKNKDFSFYQHFIPKQVVFIDNIYGGFDSCTSTSFGREFGKGKRFNTWVRARHLIYCLLDNLKLYPILSFTPPQKNIKGLGMSDDGRYSRTLKNVFDYQNTFYDTEPKLDIMLTNDALKDSYDFIICSDILEHIIGDWRQAIKNLYSYLKLTNCVVGGNTCIISAL